MKTATETCYLAYGIGRIIPTSHPEDSLSSIKNKDIFLFYRKVPFSEFGEENLTKNLNDTDWLETNVLEFHQQVERLNRETSILPFRFGTVYRSKEKMKAFLRSYYDTCIDNLKSLARKSEWGIKVFLSVSLFRKWLLLQADNQSYEEKENSPGAAYFERKKKEHELLQQEEESLNGILKEILDEVNTISQECEATEFLEGFDGNGSSLKPVTSLALLAKNDKSKLLESVAHDLTERHKSKGIVLRLSGPWPPYNFVRIDK